MKVLIICGTGNRNGFTFEMCKTVTKSLESFGGDVEIIYPLDLDLKHCTGCRCCSSSGNCVLEDDMHIIYKKFEEADLFVLASSIYFSGPTSMLKMIIDRFQPYWFRPKNDSKYVASILCGGSPKSNFDSTMAIFKAFSITTNMKWAGQLQIANTDALKLEDVIKTSHEFGDVITSFIKNLSQQ